MSGNATPAQLAAFAVLLRAKGETAAELNGLVQTMLAHATPVRVEGRSVDVVGTGGDRAHTVNISTMAAIVVAGSGRQVVKHGNRAASSMCGAADVLEELGVVIDLPAVGVEATVAEVGIGFCFAPVFHSGMRHAGPPRREIGIPTVFNVLGPLSNPARPAASAIGCADPQMAPVMAEVLAERGDTGLVVRGDDGLDELTTTTTSRVWLAEGGSVERSRSTRCGSGSNRLRLTRYGVGTASTTPRWCTTSSVDGRAACAMSCSSMPPPASSHSTVSAPTISMSGSPRRSISPATRSIPVRRPRYWRVGPRPASGSGRPDARTGWCHTGSMSTPASTQRGPGRLVLAAWTVAVAGPRLARVCGCSPSVDDERRRPSYAHEPRAVPCWRLVT